MEGVLHITTFANSWKDVYKLAAGKRSNNIQIWTHQKPDELLTSGIKETIKLVLEYFTPEKKKYDNDYHKQVEAQSKKKQWIRPTTENLLWKKSGMP